MRPPGRWVASERLGPELSSRIQCRPSRLIPTLPGQALQVQSGEEGQGDGSLVLMAPCEHLA